MNRGLEKWCEDDMLTLFGKYSLDDVYIAPLKDTHALSKKRKLLWEKSRQRSILWNLPLIGNVLWKWG